MSETLPTGNAIKGPYLNYTCLRQSALDTLEKTMIESSQRIAVVGTSEPSLASAASAERLWTRPAAVFGAIATLLRLAFSRRARSELADAGRNLESAVNEVNARLARMAAEKRGEPVPLRVVATRGAGRQYPDQSRTP